MQPKKILKLFKRVGYNSFKIKIKLTVRVSLLNSCAQITKKPMACVVNCSNPVRALAIVDALHSIAGYAMQDEPILCGDDYYLRPYAAVEMVGKKDAPSGLFEPLILQFTSYKIREPHRIAVQVLKKMGICDVTLQEYCKQVLTKHKWKCCAVPKQKLFEDAWDGSTEDDGYVKALEAMTGCVAPADWEEKRVKAMDNVLKGFSDGLKSLSRGMAQRYYRT